MPFLTGTFFVFALLDNEIVKRRTARYGRGKHICHKDTEETETGPAGSTILKPVYV